MFGSCTSDQRNSPNDILRAPKAAAFASFDLFAYLACPASTSLLCVVIASAQSCAKPGGTTYASTVLRSPIGCSINLPSVAISMR